MSGIDRTARRRTATEQAHIQATMFRHKGIFDVDIVAARAGEAMRKPLMFNCKIRFRNQHNPRLGVSTFLRDRREQLSPITVIDTGGKPPMARNTIAPINLFAFDLLNTPRCSQFSVEWCVPPYIVLCFGLIHPK